MLILAQILHLENCIYEEHIPKQLCTNVLVSS